MGLTYANIELVNAGDSIFYKRRQIDVDEIRRMTVTMLVDTGAIMLTINEEICNYLGLDPVGEPRLSRLADGTRLHLPVYGPVEIHYQGRISVMNALVLPGDSEPLLGALPLEELDLVVNPLKQTLEGAHPEGQLMSLA